MPTHERRRSSHAALPASIDVVKSGAPLSGTNETETNTRSTRQPSTREYSSALDTSYVLPNATPWSELTCGICRKLIALDALGSSTCSHPFCKFCFSRHLDSSSTPYACPSCGKSLVVSEGGMVVKGKRLGLFPLRSQQPLAFRILAKLQVQCPYSRTDHSKKCHWTGEYCQLSQHILSQHSRSVSQPKMRGAVEDESWEKKKGDSAQTTRKNLDKARSNHTTKTGSRESRSQPKSGKGGHPTTLSPEEKRQMKKISEIPFSPDKDTSPEVRRTTRLSKSAHLPSPSTSKRNRGTPDSLSQLREKATVAFKAGSFDEARAKYTDAISVCQQNPSHSTETLGTLYANRAATSLKLKDRKSCILDAEEAIKLHPSYPKAYLRKAWAHTELGEFESACATLESGEKRCPNAKELSSELRQIAKTRDLMYKIEGLLSEKKWEAAKDHASALTYRNGSSRVTMAVVRADLNLGNTKEVIAMTRKLLQMNPRHVQALQARGEAYFYNGNFKEAVNDLTNACLIDPESSSITATLQRYRKIQRCIFDAKACRQANDFEGALQNCNAALATCSPPESTTLCRVLYTERGEANLGCEEFEEAAADANKALHSKKDYLTAWSIRLQALQAQSKHQQIYDELTPIVTTWGSKVEYLKSVYEEVSAMLEKQNHLDRIDYYGMLGVPRQATVEEIRKAYRSKAKRMHPDRFRGSQYTDQDRKDAEESFKVLCEGHEILSDSHCRRLYDAGQPIEAIQKEANTAARRREQNDSFM